MLSSLDITRILAEEAESLVGANIIGIEYYRKERAVQIYYKNDRRYCLTLSFHPQRSGFYILPAGKSRLETTEKYRPFAKEVWDGTIVAVAQHPNDRIIEITVDIKKTIHILVCEILGPNANMWLLDGNRRMMLSLRQKSFDDKQLYFPPTLPEKYDAFDITVEKLANIFNDNPDANPARLMEKQIYGIDYYLAQTLLGDYDITDADDIDRIIRRMKEIISVYQSASGTIYAYYIKGKPHYYPVKLSEFEPLDKYKSLSLAQQDVNTGVKEFVETESLKDQSIKAIQSRLKRAERLLKRLEKDIEEAADYEQHLQCADLLKINIHALKRGLESIEVDDLYGEGKRKIALDPKLTGPENIESYSKRYRKGKEGLALLQRRRDNTGQEIGYLNEALDQFEHNFEQAQNEYPDLLPEIQGDKPGTTTPRLPYKEYRTSTGLTVLVGKTEADNDRLTLDYTRPYELWFHASQCPGSHVVIKYPHKNFEPSKLEIEEAAMLAAYFSKARKSAKVPVSYTTKKYVRKPRGAKPGLVTLQRYETIMVEPKELEKKERPD